MTRDELNDILMAACNSLEELPILWSAVDKYCESLTGAKPIVSGSLPLVEALEKYIELLVEELNETVGMAATHGWKSSRAEEGQRQRNRIAELRQQ